MRSCRPLAATRALCFFLGRASGGGVALWMALDHVPGARRNLVGPLHIWTVRIFPDLVGPILLGTFRAASGFWHFALLGMDFMRHKMNRVNWRDVLLAGAVAPIINALGATVFFGNDLPVMAAWFLGDVTGMIGSILILMLIFRGLRRRGAGPSA